MLTIILGAGASFDSAPVSSRHRAQQNPWRPPLTDTLFLADKVWSVEGGAIVSPRNLIPILERIRRDSNPRLERALEILKSEVASNPGRWPQLLAIQEWLCMVLTRCTDQWLELLAGATTFVDLTSRLNDWCVTVNAQINFITFNYDLFLEKAIEQCQTKPSNLQGFDRYQTNKFSVFKPHGSVDWSWKVRFDTDRNDLMDRPLSQAERSSFVLCPGPVRGAGITGMPGGVKFGSFPAVAIPVASKSQNDFIFPPGRSDKMFAALDATTAMLVVGWAAAEQHFMEEIAARVRHDIPVLVVCGEGGKETTNSLKVAGKLTNIVDSNSGFSDFLNTSQLEKWLEQCTG